VVVTLLCPPHHKTSSKRETGSGRQLLRLSSRTPLLTSSQTPKDMEGSFCSPAVLPECLRETRTRGDEACGPQECSFPPLPLNRPLPPQEGGLASPPSVSAWLALHLIKGMWALCPPPFLHPRMLALLSFLPTWFSYRCFPPGHGKVPRPCRVWWPTSRPPLAHLAQSWAWLTVCPQLLRGSIQGSWEPLGTLNSKSSLHHREFIVKFYIVFHSFLESSLWRQNSGGSIWKLLG